MPRRVSNLEWESAKAQLALAGIRQLKQAAHSATNGANTTYTVTEAATRRVVLIHIGTGNGDIRFKYGSTAAATDMPLIPARYLTIDAKKDDTIHFWNTTGAPISVNVMEIE